MNNNEMPKTTNDQNPPQDKSEAVRPPEEMAELAELKAFLEEQESGKGKREPLKITPKSSEKPTEASSDASKKDEINWDESAIAIAEGGGNKPEPKSTDFDNSSVIAAEAGGSDVKINEGFKNISEKPSTAEKSSVESAETMKESKAEIKEMMEKSAERLAVARQEMVVAMRLAEKANKSADKLSGWRKFFFQTQAKMDKEGAAVTDQKIRQEELAKRKEEFKNALAVYRRNLIEDKTQQLKITPEKTEAIEKLKIPAALTDLIKASDLELMAEYEKQKKAAPDKNVQKDRMTPEQKTAADFINKYRSNYEKAQKNKELAIERLSHAPEIGNQKAEEVYANIAAQRNLEDYAREVVNLTTSQEAIEIHLLKYQQEIDEKKQLGKGQYWEKMKEKGLEAAQWYRKQPMKNKLLVSVGLFAGGTLVGATGGLMGTAAFAGVFVGRLSQRVLGAAGTGMALEALMKRAQEAEARKDVEKKIDGKFLESLQKNLDESNKQLDEELFRILGGKKTQERRRNILAGGMAMIIGSGALTQAFGNIIPTEAKEWVAKKVGMVLPGAGGKVGGGISSETPGGRIEPINNDPSYTFGEKHHSWGSVDKPSGTKAIETIQNLKISTRGPEGAIIDHFRANPKLAETFGWDGKTDISKWAGTRAHQLWLESVKGDLENPKIIAELTKHGYQATPEDYTKAMYKIGKGFVELDPQGHMHLTDNTSFLKGISEATLSPLDKADMSDALTTGSEIPKLNASGVLNTSEVITAEELVMPKATETLLNAGEAMNNKIKEAVASSFKSEILTDGTFRAAEKVSLGKILEAVPPEAYEDKYALSRYWHSLSGAGVKTPDLPGTSWLGLTYDDFRKYSEVAKFLREKAGAGTAEKLKDMTVKEFLEKYGGELGKK